MTETLSNELVPRRIAMNRIAGNGTFHLVFVIGTFAALVEKVLNSSTDSPLIALATLILLCVACFLCLAGLVEFRAAVAAGRGNYIRPARTVLVGFAMVAVHIFAKASYCCAPLGYR
ncbi:hypothetical protein ABIE78_001598 [Sinorhizobium fredii]|uniref:hypothetical protein n=1 Tax=Rhizobium fredii TaxID=380 RepID=UPI00059EA8B0|nr:hypothetical protein [Sinorhizobium fredii]